MLGSITWLAVCQYILLTVNNMEAYLVTLLNFNQDYLKWVNRISNNMDLLRVKLLFEYEFEISSSFGPWDHGSLGCCNLGTLRPVDPGTLGLLDFSWDVRWQVSSYVKRFQCYSTQKSFMVVVGDIAEIWNRPGDSWLLEFIWTRAWQQQDNCVCDSIFWTWVVNFWTSFIVTKM